MRLEALCRLRFTYPGGWEIDLEAGPHGASPDLVLDVAELVWEPIAD